MNIFQVIENDFLSLFQELVFVGFIDFKDIIQNLFDSMFPLEELYIISKLAFNSEGTGSPGGNFCLKGST